MLTVDLYRIYTAVTYKKAVKRQSLYELSAYRHLIIGMALSGTGWGISTIILYPHVDLVYKFILFCVIIGVATASTTTLSYRKYIALSYIALILFPFIVVILCVGNDAILLSLCVVVYSIFLVKNIFVFYENNCRLLTLELKAEHREKELEIQREKANESKSMLLANISDELRTPMHAILGFSELGINKAHTAPPDELKSLTQDTD